MNGPELCTYALLKDLLRYGKKLTHKKLKKEKLNTKKPQQSARALFPKIVQLKKLRQPKPKSRQPHVSER